jgi:MerR family transcriptional regulator, light-induced transcriptional regulator
MADAGNPGLSAAQLAARTGLPVGTLRMWQSRHDFPAAPGPAGRHRRYGERDVELVREVTRLRAQGLSLPAAIERARRAHTAPAASVFAGLRHRHPEIAARTFGKRPLLALSNALEDEYCARAAGGLLLATFQRERFYRQAQRRWRELARCAELAVAMADFATLGEPAGGPVEVPVQATEPLSREWVLVVDAPGAQACLAAWEQPAQRELPDSHRRFEVVWSFEPAVVRSASGVATQLLRRLAPSVAARIPAAALDPAPEARPELRFASSLADRVVGYLAADPAERLAGH